ncbi:MAG: hypothetical protein ING62_16965, partial [Rhodocyclaceae bacterium]|nr:hypothetical protein [Rhodocyclaceae bacterium]
MSTQFKFDTEHAQKIVSLGFPEVEKHYDYLFGAISDTEACHWPITYEIIQPFLLKAGAQVVPELTRRIRLAIERNDHDSRDEIATYFYALVRHWDLKIIALLKPELEQAACMDGNKDTDPML